MKNQRNRAGAERGYSPRCSPSVLVPAAGALALALLGAGMAHSAPSTTEAVGDPVRNRVWGGCQLDLNTINMIKQAIQAGKDIDDPNVDVGFVVVYSLRRTNDGQPLTTTSGGGSTGPIICLPAASTGLGLAIEKTTEEEDIPSSEDHGSSATSIDILDAEEALAIRYRVNRTGSPVIEKRFCHTVANTGTGNAGDPTSQPPETNVDCFRVYPQ